MKPNWKQKLSSRKLWVAVVAWLTSTLAAFNVADNVVVQVTAIVSGVGAMVVYILAEAKVDASRGDGGGSENQSQ